MAKLNHVSSMSQKLNRVPFSTEPAERNREREKQMSTQKIKNIKKKGKIIPS